MKTKAKEKILEVFRKERQNTYKETVKLTSDLATAITASKAKRKKWLSQNCICVQNY